MCALAGVVTADTALLNSIDRNAMSILKHRGPDGQQFWSDETRVLLAHNRLSILDLSDAAAQPLIYQGRYHVVHNGEIFNYREIRAELEQKGYRFQTATDTEVLAAAYAAWGPACVQQFDGMFAFAIWDAATNLLLAARDRMGEKPFYFSFDGQKLLFASEMKLLWQWGLPKEMNPAMLYNFLSIGYTSNPADPTETFYSGILKLPAATWLKYDLNKNELTLEKYWQPHIEVNEKITRQQAIETFREIFSTSVARRLRSDVAVGTSLSGGLDSSAVVAFCEAQPSPAYNHHCFTIAFEGYEKDELKYAEAIVRHFGLKHSITTMNANELPALMDQVALHQEEPFLSASVLAQYKIYELAKQQGIKVLLDGQGADELLGGYQKYYRWYWQELYRSKKLISSGELEKARQLGINEAFGLKQKLAALLPELAASMLQSQKEKKAFQTPYLNRDFAFSNKRNLYYALPTTFDLNAALYFNSFTNGLEDLLRLADRNSMAHGVEVRLPFLNHQLVEFLFTLPPGYKIFEGRTKWLLRKAVEDRLPAEIVWRKDKVGLEPPQKTWMQNKNVKEAIMEAKKLLVQKNILQPAVLHRNVEATDAYAANNQDWKYWTASYLFR